MFETVEYIGCTKEDKVRKDGTHYNACTLMLKTVPRRARVSAGLPPDDRGGLAAAVSAVCGEKESMLKTGASMRRLLRFI